MKMGWRMVLVAAVALLSACVGDQKARNGAVQLVNAAHDGPRLRLLLDGTLQAAGVDYRVATGFFARGAGPVHIAVQQVVPGATDGVVTQIDQPAAKLEVNDELTIVMIDTTAAISPATSAMGISRVMRSSPLSHSTACWSEQCSTSTMWQVLLMMAGLAKTLARGRAFRPA